MVTDVKFYLEAHPKSFEKEPMFLSEINFSGKSFCLLKMNFSALLVEQ